MNALQKALLEKQKAERAKKIGQEINTNLITDLKKQFTEFKLNLEQFAVKNKKQINEDPVFRRQFHEMCKEIGVDPISSQKGALGGALGMGTFYYELGIQVTNICIALRKKTGGIVEMSDCMKYLQHLRGSAASKVSEEDVIQAVKQLQIFGPTIQIIEVENKKYISSVPIELNQDTKLLIALGEEQGYFSIASAAEKLKMQHAQVQEAVKILISEGIVWVDEPCFVNPEGQKKETLYWFPNMMKKSNYELSSVIKPNKEIESK